MMIRNDKEEVIHVDSKFDGICMCMKHDHHKNCNNCACLYNEKRIK